MSDLLGGIEAGGTKFVCAIGDGDGRLIRRTQVATAEPEATLAACAAWFTQAQRELGARIAALGIGSFGPVDLAAQRITTTPKPGWRDVALGGRLGEALGVPVAFDTDVNAAALGEARWGAGRGCDPLVYVTIGTGIGGGVRVHGALLHGALHPELGHILLAREPGDDFPGACPYHGACWEGLCAGLAIARRTGQAAEALAAHDPAWGLTARYIAQALYAVVCMVSPARIILGGSVAKGGRLGQAALFAQVRAALVELANGYLAIPQLATPERYIVAPGLGDDAGVIGALALAAAVINGR
ncbi:MAG TPA: ROK family protein [Kofleriaceae bacterium]